MNHAHVPTEPGTAGSSFGACEEIVVNWLEGFEEYAHGDSNKRFQLSHGIYFEEHHDNDVLHKTLQFDPEEIKSKLKKAKKQPGKNLWNLPLTKLSKDELLLRLLRFKDDIENVKQLTNTWPDFDEVLCSAFYYYWKSQGVVKLAIGIALSVTGIGTNEVKHELLNRSIILSAAVSASLQKEFLAHSREIDDMLEKVFMLLYMHDYHNDQGATYDYKIIEPIMTLVPYVCQLLETRSQKMSESIFYVLFKLLHTMFRCYDKKSNAIVLGWLSKHGYTLFLFEYIRKYTIATSVDLTLKLLIDTALYMMDDFKSKDVCLSLIPKLLLFLNLKDVPSLGDQSAIYYKHTTESIVQILQRTISNLNLDCAKVLLYESAFLETLADALVNNRRYVMILDPLTLLIAQAVVKIIFPIMDDSQSSQFYKDLSKNALKNVCNKLKTQIITPLCIHTINASKLFFSCRLLMYQYFTNALDSPNDETLGFMIKALAVMCHTVNNNLDYVFNDGRSAKMHSYLCSNTNLVKSFLEMVDTSAYHVKAGAYSWTRRKLQKIVKDELPDIMSDFIGIHGNIQFHLTEVITRLVLQFLDSVEDFFTPRWELVHYLMGQYYKIASLMQKDNGRVYATKLIFMWRLLDMDKSKKLVSSILQYEVGVRECTDDAQLSMLEKTFLRAEVSFGSHEATAWEQNQEKYFLYLVRDLRSVLEDTSIINHQNCRHDINWATFVLVELAKDTKDPSRIKSLKDVVFCALDFAAEQESNQMKSDVNDFIVHLYMK